MKATRKGSFFFVVIQSDVGEPFAVKNGVSTFIVGLRCSHVDTNLPKKVNK